MTSKAAAVSTLVLRMPDMRARYKENCERAAQWLRYCAQCCAPDAFALERATESQRLRTMREKLDAAERVISGAKDKEILTLRASGVSWVAVGMRMHYSERALLLRYADACAALYPAAAAAGLVPDPYPARPDR